MEVRKYRDQYGREPFDEWMSSLKDKRACGSSSASSAISKWRNSTGEITVVNPERSVRYDPTEGLETPEDIAEYLDAALEHEDDSMLLMALRNALEAVGGMTKLARRTGLSRETLYRTLSQRGNPRLSTLRAILKAFDVDLAVRPHRAA